MATEQQSEKQQLILEKGKELFWKFGVKRVTVEEICKEAGVSKMTFYKFFPNKIELAKTILLALGETSLEDYRAVMKEDLPFSEKIKKALLLKQEQTNHISIELLKDIYTNESLGLRSFIESMQQEAVKEILHDFKIAAQKGWIRKDVKPEFILYFFDRMNEMATDENLLKLYKNEQQLIMEITNFFFYGIGVEQ